MYSFSEAIEIVKRREVEGGRRKKPVAKGERRAGSRGKSVSGKISIKGERGQGIEASEVG